MKKILALFTALMLALGCSSAPDPVEVILQNMTTRQKVAQLMVVDQWRAWEIDSLYAKEQIGGLIVFRDTLSKVVNLINECQSQVDIPLEISLDAEWGAGMRFLEFPPFPRARYLAAMDNDSLLYEMGRAVARELLSIGVTTNYAPDVDVDTNPDNPVIGSRSYSPDPAEVSKYGIAYARGMQSLGVSACAKHFPGHGDTHIDSHKGLPVLEFDRARLDSIELAPFRDLIAAGIDMIMIGHLAVPVLDSTGTPASISRPIVTGLLREELGYDGLIVTDALQMGALRKTIGEDDEAYAQIALMALQAGVDYLLMPGSPVAALDLICQKVEEGEVSIEELDEHVRRVLRHKASKGMLEPDYNRFVDYSAINTDISASILKEISLNL